MKFVREAATFHPDRPFHMVWLATNMCNARCLHCSSNSGRAAANELSTSEACDLIDQLCRFGVVDLAISGGEPLLRRDIFEIITHAIERGLAVGIGSNGASVTPAQISTLAKIGVNRFQVSLDGFAPAHDHLRSWPGLFNRATATIKSAVASGLRTHVCCTVNRFNYEQLEPLAEFVATLGVKRINFSRYVPTGRGTDELDLNSAEWRIAIGICNEFRTRYSGKLEIVTHLAQEILMDHTLGSMPAFIGCQAGIGQGCVTADGTVWPCVLLPIPVGNIRKRAFAEIWQGSEILRVFRERNHLEGMCGRCVVKEKCGGCRAVAFAKTGNYLASDPRCWLEQLTEP